MTSRPFPKLMILAALLFAPLAMARPPGDGLPPMRVLAQRLNLTPEQQQAARASHEAHKQAGKAAHEAIRAKHDELRLLWTAENPDRAQILAKMNEIGALRQQMEAGRVDARLEFIKLLTPEQRAEIRKIAAEPPPARGRHHRKPT